MTLNQHLYYNSTFEHQNVRFYSLHRSIEYYEKRTKNKEALAN